MPSPFHQKYATQNHRFFGKMPEPEEQQPTQDRRASVGSTSSTGSASSPPSSPDMSRRRSSTSKFAALEALKRPQDANAQARRASFTDAKPATGILGNLWNNFTRGPASPPPAAKKEPRDTTTLRQ